MSYTLNQGLSFANWNFSKRQLGRYLRFLREIIIIILREIFNIVDKFYGLHIQ